MCTPGGGRNDIPMRLKRQFCVFSCNMPGHESMDHIFRTIGLGHFSIQRGFNHEIRKIISKLVPVTRIIWAKTKSKMLPTPTKFHYIFNLRDLSRIWQGMTFANSEVRFSYRAFASFLLFSSANRRYSTLLFCEPTYLDFVCLMECEAKETPS